MINESKVLQEDELKLSKLQTSGHCIKNIFHIIQLIIHESELLGGNDIHKHVLWNNFTMHFIKLLAT